MEKLWTTLIRGSNFSTNVAISGAALYLYNSQVNSICEISDCFFNDNNSTLNGGAIYMEKFANALIKGNFFSNNRASLGGAIQSIGESMFFILFLKKIFFFYEDETLAFYSKSKRTGNLYSRGTKCGRLAKQCVFILLILE